MELNINLKHPVVLVYLLTEANPTFVIYSMHYEYLTLPHMFFHLILLTGKWYKEKWSFEKIRIMVMIIFHKLKSFLSTYTVHIFDYFCRMFCSTSKQSVKAIRLNTPSKQTCQKQSDSITLKTQFIWVCPRETRDKRKIESHLEFTSQQVNFITAV